MNPPLHRRRLIGAVILGSAVLLGGVWFARLDFRQRISTDVLDLLPAGERSPELAMVRSLASEAEARVMLLVLTNDAGAPASAEATRDFAAELARRPAFEQAMAVDDPAPRDALGRALFERRLILLFPLWLRERTAAHAAARDDPRALTAWLADDAATRLGLFLSSPEALPYQDALPADPLLLVPGVIERLKGGIALIPGGGGAPNRVWARIAASPLQAEGQQPVFAAIGQALAATRARHPGLTVAYTGVNCFAADSRARIQRELSRVNLLSVAAVLAVALFFIRGAQRVLHLAPPVLLAILGAWIGTTVAFGRVHVLVFVVGSLLTGVAVDYGFYLYMQAPASPREDTWAKVIRLRKPLFSSCLTTVAGFALLLFSGLPLLRQLGVYVGTGLLCALGGAIVYFSMLDGNFLRARAFASGPVGTAGARRTVRRLLVALWLAGLPGLFLITWKDDIRDLEIPSPVLQSEDARLRGLFGATPGSAVYLTRGRDLSEARDSLERFDSWLRTNGRGAGSANLGAIIPTRSMHADAMRFTREHPEFPERLRSALASAGFQPGAVTPFFEAYAGYAAHATGPGLDTAVRGLQGSLTGPLSLLLHPGPPLGWFVTLAAHPPAGPPPPQTQTLAAGELESLNLMFVRYRQSALRLSLAGLAIVGLGVLLAYGPRDGIRIFSIPCGAGLGLFGWFGWLGQPLNFFHLLGAFLGVCLAHNYSIFSVTSAYRHEPPPVSVRLSALCAAASFGVLALSAIPVVHALGETVALMVLAALLAVEFEHFTPIAQRP